MIVRILAALFRIWGALSSLWVIAWLFIYWKAATPDQTDPYWRYSSTDSKTYLLIAFGIPAAIFILALPFAWGLRALGRR